MILCRSTSRIPVLSLSLVRRSSKFQLPLFCRAVVRRLISPSCDSPRTYKSNLVAVTHKLSINEAGDDDK